jgi:Cft2 family RNA processing exonuclease
MQIQNLNPDTEIGASAWWVTLNGHRLLLDTGTHPKREGAASLPLYGLVGSKDLDAIAISHCHHDHVGSLPVALQHFPSAHVLMTELSYFLVERILHNSVNVMKRQRDDLGIREYPLYTHEQVDDLAPVFQGFKYNREVEWASLSQPREKVPSPTLEFFDAGHTLGSAGILVRGSKETLFYTGDVCFRDQTILRGARFDGVKADVLIMETTRGGRSAGTDYSRETEIERLAVAIEKVMQRGGSVLIPSFALGRTQEILALLALLMEAGRVRKQPVYIGGLGRVFTEIYDLQSHRAHRLHPELQLNESLNLIVLDPKKAGEIKLTGRHLFVLTAGMMTENTAAHDMAWRMLGEARHGIFFVGYADPQTPGGRLKVSQPGEAFVFSASSGEVERQCEVQEFDLTAHAQREDLLEFVGQVDPHTVVLGHGDAAARAWFDDQIRRRHPKIKVFQPGPGEALEV